MKYGNSTLKLQQERRPCLHVQPHLPYSELQEGLTDPGTTHMHLTTATQATRLAHACNYIADMFILAHPEAYVRVAVSTRT